MKFTRPFSTFYPQCQPSLNSRCSSCFPNLYYTPSSFRFLSLTLHNLVRLSPFLLTRSKQLNWPLSIILDPFVFQSCSNFINLNPKLPCFVLYSSNYGFRIFEASNLHFSSFQVDRSHTIGKFAHMWSNIKTSYILFQSSSYLQIF